MPEHALGLQQHALGIQQFISHHVSNGDSILQVTMDVL